MVLNEVVESARALTGARYGAIATIDEAGAPQDFVTSGFTADEHQHIVEWPDGPRLFEFFRDLPGPLRIPDVPAYVRALGFSPDDRLLSKTFQGTPMRHRAASMSATSTWSRRRAARRSRTRRSWCCSPRRPRSRSPMRASTAPTSRR